MIFLEERIAISRLSKKFSVGHKKKTDFLTRVISLFSGKEPKKNIQALEGVSFRAGSGEVVGIVGENGSGKSTLLRLIAGIYQPDSGKIVARGKIVSLINLYAGLKERLTMRDNIYLCSSLFGLSKSNIDKNLDSIIKFSELQSFLDTKIYQFSEGMKQRLAFSVAIHCNPEILLLDEVFEVGDEEFRNKSSKRIKEVADAGGCVILVSHDLDLIEKYCSRAIWIDKARIRGDGDTVKILDEYKKASLVSI